MLKEGGWKSLWCARYFQNSFEILSQTYFRRGNGINVLKIAPESALKFAAYEQVKRFIRGPENRPMSIFERFVAGACAGETSLGVENPNLYC